MRNFGLNLQDLKKNKVKPNGGKGFRDMNDRIFRKGPHLTRKA